MLPELLLPRRAHHGYHTHTQHTSHHHSPSSPPSSQLSQDIHEEVGDQNGLLDTMRSGIENAGSTVQKTMGALGTMFEAGGNKQMCYLVVGIVALFIILHYFISKVW